MKRFLTLAAAAALLVSCSGGTSDWSVSVLGADGGTVNVFDLLSGEKIASSEDGTLTGTSDKNALLAVEIDGDEGHTMFFNDGKPVTVNFEDNTLKGSSLNEKLHACELEVNRIGAEMMEAFGKFRLLSGEEQQAYSSKIEELQQKLTDSYRRILDENRANIIPVAFMQAFSRMLDEGEFKDIVESEAPYAKHPYTNKIKEKVEETEARFAAIEAAKQEAIGKKFTDLEEPGTDGKMHKLSEYLGQGKWVFVDFWASWCGPCRAEMPNVVAAYEKYHPKGLEIVGLSFDNDKDAWLQAIKDLKMPWTHLSDLKGWQTVASDTYNVKSIPASLLVDPDGIIVARDLRGEELGSKLSEIFGE